MKGQGLEFEALPFLCFDVVLRRQCTAYGVKAMQGNRLKSECEPWVFLRLVLVLMVAVTTGCQSLGRESVMQVTLRQPEPLASNFQSSHHAAALKIEVLDRRDILAPGISRKWGRFQVGQGRNGFGEQIDPVIVVTEPVETTLTKIFERELATRDIRTGDGASDILTVEVEYFFSEFDVQNMVVAILKKAVAELRMKVTLRSSDGREKYSATMTGKGEKKVSLSLYEIESTEIALNQALAHAMQMIMSDPRFNAALNECQPCN